MGIELAVLVGLLIVVRSHGKQFQDLSIVQLVLTVVKRRELTVTRASGCQPREMMVDLV
jgi:hypothetical protein